MDRSQQTYSMTGNLRRLLRFPFKDLLDRESDLRMSPKTSSLFLLRQALFDRCVGFSGKRQILDLLGQFARVFKIKIDEGLYLWTCERGDVHINKQRPRKR